MKVKASVRKLCDACRFVRRRGRLYVVCKENKKVCVVVFNQDWDKSMLNVSVCICSTNKDKDIILFP